jgi:two-component system, NarL family, sensor kinase
VTRAGGSAASRRRAAALLAYGALTIGSWVLLAPRTQLPGDLALGWWVCGALVPVFLVAALLLAQLPGHGVGRVLATMACAHATGIAAGVAGAWLAQQDLAGAGLLRWLAAVSWVGTLPLLAVLVLIFPTGRPLSPRWRPVLYAQLVTIAVLTVVVAIAPGGVPAPLQPLAALAGVVLLGTGMLAAVSQVARWRAATGAERAQLRAFAVLAAVLALSYVVGGLLKLTGLDDTWPNLDAVSYLTLIAGLPVAVGLAVLRHRLYGIDPLVNRVLVWAMVSAVLLGAYLVVIAAVTALLGGSRSPAPVALVAAAVVALALAPVRARAQRLVDRLMYGDRGDPVRILRALGVRLSTTVAPDEAAWTLVETLTGTLRLPWAAVDLDREGHWQRMAEAGDPDAASQPVTIPLTHAGEQVGRLLVQPRRGEATLTRADRQLLADLAAQAGPAVHAARLIDQLTESRERLVQAREAERGRLRRDLHDSLSPALAGIGLSADAAARVVETDPEAAAALLARVVAEARASTETIRRLLADLRPPGLEELGLVAALEERARQLSRPGEFDIQLRIADPLAPLAPGVEVAAYRIAVEALTNAARHSGGRRCRLELTTDRLLRLAVTDDGHGLSSPNGEGVGIHTMRERARELGGRLTIGPANGSGVRVVAELPTLRG